MKEGYWLNYERSSGNNVFEIDEHEQWLRRPGNAKTLGVPASVIKKFKGFEDVEDRDQFLMYVMAHAPVMRLRGHGASWTFEFSNTGVADPLYAVYSFCSRYAGDYTHLVINNFATRDMVDMRWGKFKERYAEGEEKVLRAASTKKMVIKEGFEKYLK